MYLSDLSAISQRDYTQYYQHVLKQEEQICQAVQEFFSQHIQYSFLDEDCEHQRRHTLHTPAASLQL